MLEDLVAGKQVRRLEEATQKEKERVEQEKAEAERLKDQLEAKKQSDEKIKELTAVINSRKKVSYKGHFSKAPLENFNEIQNDLKTKIELSTDDTKKH